MVPHDPKIPERRRPTISPPMLGERARRRKMRVKKASVLWGGRRSEKGTKEKNPEKKRTAEM
jgi:hypothetical protein